ncbi:MAG TPA: glutamate--tRNA ligase, partial [Polyangiales bacterium]|nr:glutamate--tRNA ligase [Polyangiales bacterium]
IEDTDQVRSTRESEDAILESLRWLGLRWDEGPDVGGPKGPYRQSERGEIYAAHAQLLLERGHAFECFCSAERLEGLRKRQLVEKGKVGYDGHCLGLSREEVQSRKAAGEPFVIRMKVPATGACVIKDLLREPVSIEWQQVDMQVLVKADGMPTYHLANVVDDHLMEITHVLRGEEWITSAPKHLLLYQYFGWEPPVLCHMPLLRNPDKSKLSKRKNPTSINYYRRMGFLPEALLNYLGMMGWTMPNGEEKFSLDEMAGNFDIKRVSLGGPVFDLAKLSWLNGRYIRENLSAEGLAERLAEWAVNREYVVPILKLVQERVDKLSDVLPKVAHFFSSPPPLSEQSFQHKKLSLDEVRKVLFFASRRFDELRVWRADVLRTELEKLGEALNLKIRDLLFPLFVAISGQSVSTPLFETLEILGPDLCRMRLREALEATGGLSKKQAEQLDREYRTLGGPRETESA